MHRKRKSLQYLVAVLAAAIGLIVRYPMWGLLGSTIPYMTFFPAVMLSSWYGGLGPGIVCTSLSGLAALLYLVEPVGMGLSTPDLAGLLLFVGSGTFMSWVSQQMINLKDAEQGERIRCEQTLASIADAVIAVDPERRVTFLNSVASELTGWTSGDASGRMLSEVFQVVDAEDPNSARALEQALASGRTCKAAGHVELVAKDGRKILIEQSASPIRESNGDLAGGVLVFRDVTARTKSEKDLLASREKLRATLESITDAFMALGSEWQFEYLNSAAERALGRAREALLGRNHWEEYPEMLGTLLEEQYRRAMRERIPVDFEIFSKRSSKWFEVNAFPSDSGGISVYFRDITQRKQADAVLAQARAATEEARDLLQTTLASIGDGVIATDAAMTITFINKVAAGLVGLPIEQALGRKLEEVFIIVNEDSHDPVDNPAMKAVRDGLIVGLANHTLLISAQGDETPIDDSAAPIHDADGSIIGSVLVFRDVAQRRASEKALKESEERLRLALRVGEIGVWDWDILTDRISWSERVYTMHGVKPGEFGGRIQDLSPLIHADDRDRIAEAVKAAVERGEPYQVQLRAVHPDGQMRWLETTGQVLRDDAEQPYRMLGATTDITRRKLAEVEMKRQARELHRSNADLERFAFAASHDLQEPLRMVTIYTQLLSRKAQGKLDDEATKYLEIILDGTKRMRTLIQDLLAYAQVAHEGRSLELVNANTVLNRVLQACEPLVRETCAVIEHGPLPVVLVQESHLVQVFQNLIVNAIRYRSTVPPKVQVNAIQQDGEWIFSVADNGIGIAPHHRQNVFELFKRLNAKSHGTGIGLALCQRIVEGYGGRIWVDSELNQGSTFYFSLPINPELPSVS